MATVTLFFGTNTETMLATKALRDAEIPATMIPTPKGIETSAHLCLTVNATHELAARGAINLAKVLLGGVIRQD